MQQYGFFIASLTIGTKFVIFVSLQLKNKME